MANVYRMGKGRNPVTKNSGPYPTLPNIVSSADAETRATGCSVAGDRQMTPNLTLTIKANPSLHSREAVTAYIDEIVASHPEISHYRGALVDIVNTARDDVVALYSVPAMCGDRMSSVHGTRLLWMPEIKRAALNAYQSGDWQWTDASDPEDAIRRYLNDDMSD